MSWMISAYAELISRQLLAELPTVGLECFQGALFFWLKFGTCPQTPAGFEAADVFISYPLLLSGMKQFRFTLNRIILFLSGGMSDRYQASCFFC